MRRISAQYIFTSAGDPLKRGVVTVDDDNTVVSVADTGGNLAEGSGIEFFNGIIIPGLVNCHTHLELSHMRGTVGAGTGLADFITHVREKREAQDEMITSSAREADLEMVEEGIVACGDISNTDLAFSVKRESRISYVTFIEVFGVHPLKAVKRMNEAEQVKAAAVAMGLKHHITPHSVYSVSHTLFKLITGTISNDSLTTLHFLESDDERELVNHRRGRLAESYRSLGITPDELETTGSHISTAIRLAELTCRLILVHNTCIDHDEMQILMGYDNIWFCLCPASNIRVSGMMPPVRLLRQASGRVVTGTDSLASSDRLSILDQLKLLHEELPDLPLGEVIRWGTINGACALGVSDKLGSIEPGKQPGLLLVEPVDLQAMRLLPESRVRRLL